VAPIKLTRKEFRENAVVSVIRKRSFPKISSLLKGVRGLFKKININSRKITLPATKFHALIPLRSILCSISPLNSYSSNSAEYSAAFTQIQYPKVCPRQSWAKNSKHFFWILKAKATLLRKQKFAQ